MNHSLWRIVLIAGLISTGFNKGITQNPYTEKYRPQYHFSPQKGWIGDPDGLIKFRNTYHLFWWGHATSQDLIHWTEQPYPMKGGTGFHYFSGSVVVDKNNTAGFGDSALVAVYTMHTTDDKPEFQALSYSIDGLNFQFYKNNPVLDIGSNSFRDPQVFWYEPSAAWIMVVTHPHLHKISFYKSANLKEWTYLSEFGNQGATGNDWEVPDLFQLETEDQPSIKKWVLSIGVGPNRMQYFVGEFDGVKFIADKNTCNTGSGTGVMWADFGTDFYAARTWRDLDNPSSQVTWLGWMGNWSYARDVPTSWGKGFESIPRNLSLKKIGCSYQLIQRPIPALKMLRSDSASLRFQVADAEKTIQSIPPGNSYELHADIDLANAKSVGFNLMKGNGKKLVVGYNRSAEELYIDRSNVTDATDSSFLSRFRTNMKAPLKAGNKLSLVIFVDKSSVEVFANDGELVLSATTFQGEEQQAASFFADGKADATIQTWRLKSIR